MPGRSNPRIGIILLHYDGIADTEECLKSLSRLKDTGSWVAGFTITTA